MPFLVPQAIVGLWIPPFLSQVWLVCFSHKVVLDATLYLRKASYLPCPLQILVDGGEFGGLVPGLALSLPPVPLLISSAPNLFCFFIGKRLSLLS